MVSAEWCLRHRLVKIPIAGQFLARRGSRGSIEEAIISSSSRSRVRCSIEFGTIAPVKARVLVGMQGRDSDSWAKRITAWYISRRSQCSSIVLRGLRRYCERSRKMMLVAAMLIVRILLIASLEWGHWRRWWDCISLRSDPWLLSIAC